MIHIFIGTKAQLIKMAPVMRELQDRNIEYNFIFSGQHQNTIDALRKNFGVKEPDVVLHAGKDVVGVVQMGFWLIKILFMAMIKRSKVWKGDRAGVVLNHGDTFSTLAGSVLAKIFGHKNAHIESGLRSFKLFHPFPEELTRVLVFKLTDYYFCPNQWAYDNLSAYPGEKFVTGGNTLYDALKFIKGNPNNLEVIVPNEPYVVVSIHRFENIFNKKLLVRIIELIENISMKFKVLLICHKPTVRKLIGFGLYDRLGSNVRIELRPRYDYANFISLVSTSEFVVTDGGSNQEECYYLGKPCLVLRKATERTEGLDVNVVISEFDSVKIGNFIDNYKQFASTEKTINPSPTEYIVNKLFEIVN